MKLKLTKPGHKYTKMSMIGVFLLYQLAVRSTAS